MEIHKKPVVCPVCSKEIPRCSDFAAFQNHFTKEHVQISGEVSQEQRDTTMEDLFNNAVSGAKKDTGKPTTTALNARPRPGQLASSSGVPSTQSRGTASGERNSVGTATKDGSESPRSDSSRRRKGSRSESPPKWLRGTITDDSSGPDTSKLIKQPETRPISQEQLVTEVKGIYAGLVMVESKCIEVDNAQNAQNDPANTLNNEQWQALIALHRTLLHEHHDFFLASQHSSASLALRRLASKYAMPARMWRHGIHSFLELLRHRLPASLEHMLTFIYLAYSMMALLYETVPAFEDTWIECLGDLGRYRMAIEDANIRDRETWTSVSRHWYSKATDKAPTTGRLYHHLAILARPMHLQQLYYYTKSLCVAMPFLSARESIMTLFDTVLPRDEPIEGDGSDNDTVVGSTTAESLAVHPGVESTRQTSECTPFWTYSERAFVRAHGIMFSKKSLEDLESSMREFIYGLDAHIDRSEKRWLEPGYYIGLSNICAIVGYGNESNPIYNIIKQVDMGDSQVHSMTGSELEPSVLKEALRLANRTHRVVLQRFNDPNILPYLHVTLTFIYHLTYYPEAMAYIAPEYPWKLTATTLNFLMDSIESYSRIESIRFPEYDKGKGGDQLPHPLPEDYAMRGLLWVEKYFPDGWFSNDDEKYFKVASMSEERRERVLYLGCRIAARGDGKWLRYDSTSHRFSVEDTELEELLTTYVIVDA